MNFSGYGEFFAEFRKEIGREDMDINYIKEILNQEICDVGRTSDMCWIIFGSEDNKKDAFYSLHLQCPWRIRQGSSIVLSNLDIYELAPEVFAIDEEWDDTKRNLFDDKVEKFMMTGEKKVNNVSVTAVNDLAIYLSDSSIIECFVNDLKYESWRFFKKGDKQHLVVTGAEIEE